MARSAAIEERRRSSLGTRPSAASGVSARPDENPDFVSRSARLEERRKSDTKTKSSFFDPDRIRFTQADKDRVEISAALTRREDKVIALCAKYWNLAKDPAFERIVFLYSRKFGGRHFEAFRAIKLGRARLSTDDEILSAVAAILTTSYNYSVSGDLYMQIMWRRLRARMEARSVAERLAAPGPEATTRAQPAPALESRVRAKRAQDVAATDRPEGLGLRAASRVAALPQRRVLPPSATPQSSPPPSPSAQPALAAPQLKAPLARPAAPPAPPEKPTAAERPKPIARPTLPAAESSRVIDVAEKKSRTRRRSKASGASTKPREQQVLLTPAPSGSGRKLLGPVRAGPEPLREIQAKRGSISDSIRKLSGKTYDVYRELFLEKVRDHIHRTLLASRTKSRGIFDTTVNDAEDYIFFFISAHYDDPFMDWERSAEREAVEALGFSMPSLDPIVEACFKKL